MEQHGKEKVLIVIERDSYQKDAEFIRSLVNAVATSGYRVVWYNPHGVGSSERITPNKTINALPKFIRIPIKFLGILRQPKYLKHYLSVDALREETISGRCRNLKKFVRRLETNTEVAILSRSAGGRISSLVSDELGIRKLICLGYPFKHPKKPIEHERYEHLENLQTPFLIIQGINDEYGGGEIQEKYFLSPQVFVEFVDTDHNFKLSQTQFNSVTERIRKFLN